MHAFTVTISLIGIVVIVASLISGAFERRGLPMVPVFLLLGALLGPLGLGLADIGFTSPELSALATLALALVLFSDAVTLDLRELRARKHLMLRVLGPGTLVPAGLTMVAAHFVLGLPWASAVMLGAALASTDPILLRHVLRSPAFPERPKIALRMETGMNDVVLLPILVVAMLFAGGGVHGLEGALEAPRIVPTLLGLFLLGPLLGAIVGWIGITALSWARRRAGVRRDYESLYALGLAFSAFAAAEAVGGSGFVAAFAAGLMVESQDAELCDCFLEYGEATAEMMLLLTFVALGTTLIWTGLAVIDGRTLLFAAIALLARGLVLYPVLGGLGLGRRERALTAMFGPRGLSSLLLLLLPVFAGVPGAPRLFSVACLVVLISVVVHGGLIAWFLRSRNGTATATESPVEAPASAPHATAAPRITIEALSRERDAGTPVVLVDARTERAFRGERRTAAGAVRVNPEEPVRDATRLRLSKRATLVVYCA